MYMYFFDSNENNMRDLNKKMYKCKKNKNHSVVFFLAPWCGHCKNFVPQWDKLSSVWENEGTDVKLLKVECGKPNEKKEHSEIMEKYNIKGYPTILVFDNGTPTNRISRHTRISRLSKICPESHHIS